MALWIVEKPWTFDVMETENMFGDILSNLGAGLMGGLALAPSADIGENNALFQPCHGSAPEIARHGVANPFAMILSGAMMLDCPGQRHELSEMVRDARRLAYAVDATMPEAQSLTRDLGGTALTRDAAQAVTTEAQAHGAQLVIHENFRFQPWYRAIRKALNGGQIGQALQATFRLRPGDGQGPRAYLDRQPYFRRMERLLVHETGVQWIDTFRFLLGDPIAVYADLRRINTEIAGEDAGYILFDYPDGVRVLLDGAPLENSASDYLTDLEIEDAMYRSATENRKLTPESTP